MTHIPTSWYVFVQLICGPVAAMARKRSMAKRSLQKETPTARIKILAAAMNLIRAKGYAATSVDSLCETAGVTKGAFFHHFESKEDLAVAAAQYWSNRTAELFSGAPYQIVEDPLERLLAYIKFRKDLMQGELPDFTCLVGTMVQEVYSLHPGIRKACQDSIFGHAATLVPTIEEVKNRHAPAATWTASSLAAYIQGSIQGAFILAKAGGEPGPASACLDHLENYVRLLFTQPHS